MAKRICSNGKRAAQRRAKGRILRMMQTDCMEAETWGGGVRFIARRVRRGWVLEEYRLVRKEKVRDG